MMGERHDTSRLYLCSSAECVAKKSAASYRPLVSAAKPDDSSDPFVPLRLLVCGHSMCELCLLDICRQQSKEYIKCRICSQITTIGDAVHRTIAQHESDIKKWTDPTAAGTAVLRLDMNDMLPLDLYQLGLAVDCGAIAATKAAECVDLDLDDDINAVAVGGTQAPANDQRLFNSLREDNTIMKTIESKIPETAPKPFQDTVHNGVKAFLELSTNHMAIKRSTDETKEWLQESKQSTREMFHRFHSILQFREKELLRELDALADGRQEELRVFMNEILTKRSDLKGKLLQSIQTHTDKERQQLRKQIDLLSRDSNCIQVNPPKTDFKFIHNENIEDELKKFGKFERQRHTSTTGATSGAAVTENGTNHRPDNTVTLSDDEDEAQPAMDDQSEDTLNREVVNILHIDNPHKFYVQKVSDKERFDIMCQQIEAICNSAYNHAPSVDAMAIDESVFAYSLIKKCWCRGTVANIDQSGRGERRFAANVDLIDYGVREVINWDHIREKRPELFDPRKYPPFAIKCALYNVKPKSSSSASREWSAAAKNLFKLYVTNNAVISFDFETRDGYKFVDLIHYDVPDVVYQIPSVIEALVRNEFAALTGQIDFGSYCRHKSQTNRYKSEELPKLMSTSSVLVSHVETPDHFYVQLQRHHKELMDMLEKLNAAYNRQTDGIYTYYCPKPGTPCAALFSGDNKYYRAVVKSRTKTSGTEAVIQFVDFGNEETVRIRNLRLLKDDFFEMPKQAIICGLIHVEPAFGFKWKEDGIKDFKFSISNEKGPQILTMTVNELRHTATKEPKLMVVLRSYDGGEYGVKVNELLVTKGAAHSTGHHSISDDDRAHTSHGSQVSSVSGGGDSRSSSAAATAAVMDLSYKVSALIVTKDLVERNQRSNSDKRTSLIKVRVTLMESPAEFFVQITKAEVKDYFEQHFENELYSEYASSRHPYDRTVGYNAEDLCAFKVNNDWRRGQVIDLLTTDSASSPDAVPVYQVLAIDYGTKHTVNMNQMRELTDKFRKDGPFAMKCKLHGIRPAGGDNWTATARDECQQFLTKEDLMILIKDDDIENEPIAVRLYAKVTTIPGAFSRQKTVYDSLHSALVNKGLAFNGSTVSDNSHENIDDDQEINNEDIKGDRQEMPLTLFPMGGSALEALSLRYQPSDLIKDFKYKEPMLPTQKSFFGWGTEFVANKDFDISFRIFHNDCDPQPTTALECQIMDTLREKGALAPFVGSLSKGNACTAYFNFDRTWNRAEIVGVGTNSDKQILPTVRYVDYGNQESLLVENLSSDVFGRNVPKQAIKCHIINIKPRSEEADKQIRNIIYKQVLDNKCRYFWENYPQTPMKVSIDIPMDNTYVSLLAYLETEGLLATDRNEESEALDEYLNIEGIIERTYGLYPKVFDANRFYEVVIAFSLTTKYAFFNIPDVQRPQDRDRVINDEHNRFLSGVVDVMRNNIETFATLNSPAEGTPCVACSPDDKSWYRALIVGVKHSELKAHVIYVDYGNKEWVPFKDLRAIPRIHLKPKAHSILCEFFNIKPANNQLWSRSEALATEIAKHLAELPEDPPILAKFKSTTSPFKVDLYVASENDRSKPERHVFQTFVDRGVLEYCDPRDVWKAPIEATQSYRAVRVKNEPMN